MGIINIGDSAV